MFHDPHAKDNGTSKEDCIGFGKKTAPDAVLEPFWNNPQISELLFYRYVEESLDRIGLPEVKSVTGVLVDRQRWTSIEDVVDTKGEGGIC